MEQIKTHSSKIMIAGGSAVALLCLGMQISLQIFYTNFKRFLSKKKKDNKTSETKEYEKSEIISETSPQKKQDQCSDLNIKSEQNEIEIYEKSEYPQISQKEQSIEILMHLKGKKELSIDDILELYDNTILLMKEDYCELTIASRKKRRELDLQDQNYFNLVFSYVVEIEDIMRKYLSQLLESIQITYENFEKNLIKILKQNEQNAAILFITREKIKEFLPKKTKTTIEKAKEIFKFQLKLLTSKSYLFNHLKKSFLVFLLIYSKYFKKQTHYQQQLMISAITTILFDYVHEEFSIEEEDLMNLQETQRDIDLLNIFQEIQNAMNQLLLQFY